MRSITARRFHPDQARKRIVRGDVLVALSQRFGFTRLCEVGVKSGRLTEWLASLLPQAEIICVDPWRFYEDWPDWDNVTHRKHEHAFDQRAAPFGNRIRKMKMTSLEAAAMIPDASLDLVFIDADHSYPAVRADIDAWMPKVRPGGVLSGHDYDNTEKYGNYFKGVDRAVLETFGDNFNVERAYVWWVQVGEQAHAHGNIQTVHDPDAADDHGAGAGRV